MPRVVLDANVWISASLMPGSVPSLAIDLARTGRVQSVISEPLIDQVLRALARLGFPNPAIRDADVEIRDLSLLVNPTVHLSVITAKESDNRVLECAVTGNADAIVTGDRKHLLRLGTYAGIPLISPRDAVQTFGLSDPTQT